MTPSERDQLRFFRPDEKRADGRPLNWAVADYATFMSLDLLRGYLGSEIRVIRETHPNRPGAIDAYCPQVSLEQVYMQLTRLQGVSYGVYSGNSFHIDRRAPEEGLLWPARWMAIKPEEVKRLVDSGLEKTVQMQSDGTMIKDDWVYLLWNHPHSFLALAFVLDIAAQKQMHGGGGATGV